MAVAAAAVNNFRTVTKVVGFTTDVVYEAPVGFVGVILLFFVAILVKNKSHQDEIRNRENTHPSILLEQSIACLLYTSPSPRD